MHMCVTSFSQVHRWFRVGCRPPRSNARHLSSPQAPNPPTPNNKTPNPECCRVPRHKAVEIVTNGSLVSRLLGEVMLSCKDPSKKTRDAAFDALVSVAKASEVAGVSQEWCDACVC